MVNTISWHYMHVQYFHWMTVQYSSSTQTDFKTGVYHSEATALVVQI